MIATAAGSSAIQSLVLALAACLFTSSKSTVRKLYLYRSQNEFFL